MLQIKAYVLMCLFVWNGFVPLNGAKIPFHLRFIGRTDNGLEMVYPRYTITYGTAVNLCYKLCKEQWWCTALRKCADRPRLFQCDVVCQFNSFENRIYGHGNGKCVSVQVNQMGPNVAVNKTVKVIRNRVYRGCLPKYATDAITDCTTGASGILHTLYETNPWMQIMLGRSVDVAMVVVYNRQRLGGDKFLNALIEVADSNVWRPCGFYKGPGVNYQIIFIICNEDVRGDILQITLHAVPGTRTNLMVCEVEVFERI